MLPLANRKSLNIRWARDFWTILQKCAWKITNCKSSGVKCRSMPDGRRSVKARMWHGPLRYTLQDLTVLRSPRKLAPPSGKHTEVCSFILLSTRLIKKVKKQIFSSYLPLPTSMTNNSSNQPRTVLFSLFSRGENSLQNMKLSHVSKVTQLEKSWL